MITPESGRTLTEIAALLKNQPEWKIGSAREFGESGILSCFRESHKFGSGHGHPLRLQQKVMQVFIAAPTSQQSFDISVHRFHNAHRHCSATIRSPGRVASIKNVTELLIVVGGRLQGLSDILRRQLVRLDTVW